MYKIIKDGATVGLTGAPNYIKKLDNGCYGLCSEQEAQGVAFNGTPYQLEGRTEMGGLEAVTVAEVNEIDVTNDHLAAAQVFVEQAEVGSIDDNTALQHKGLFEVWRAGAECAAGSIRQYGEKLYKCLQAHTSQSDWIPDATPALWAVINRVSAGTLDDPIAAERGMEYEYGLYYLDPDPEHGGVYLCEREGEAAGGTVVLHFLPHELTGNYFTLVE